MEKINPSYYKFNINGINVDLFEIADVLGLNIRLFSALKYISRNKENKVEDLKKAIRSLELEIQRLSDV